MGTKKAPKHCFWRGETLWGRIKVSGRLYRFSLQTDDPIVARARVKEERNRLIARLRFGDARRTFAEVLAAWAAEIPHQVGPATVARYAVSLKQMEPMLDGAYLDEIDGVLVGEIVSRRRAAGVSNATIRRDLTALSSVLEYAIAEEWRDDNPALARLRRLKERRDPIVLPEPAHIEFVISRCPPMLAAMVRLAWLTGCRQDELVSAERRQFHRDARQLTVIGKGNKLRTIELSEAAHEVLASLPVNLACRKLFWHRRRIKGRAEVGGYANIASRFAAIVRGAQKVAQREGRDFRPFRFHDLRHRYAVDWLKSGRSIYDLQQHLGHTSVKVTEMYLAYLTPEEAMRAKHGDHNKDHTYIGSDVEVIEK